MIRKLLTVGRCMDDAVKEATEEWFRQHGGMRDREEAFANGIKVMNATMELRPGGIVTVHVILTARKAQQNHIDYHRYQRQPGEGYVRVLKPRA